VAAATRKVKKFVLRILAAVDIGVWGLVIRDMQIRHPRRLPAQLISDERGSPSLSIRNNSSQKSGRASHWHNFHEE
jgi:hypothetical protein